MMMMMMMTSTRKTVLLCVYKGNQMHIDEKGPGFTQMQNYEKIIYEIVIISCIAVISKKYQFTLLII